MHRPVALAAVDRQAAAIGRSRGGVGHTIALPHAIAACMAILVVVLLVSLAQGAKRIPVLEIVALLAKQIGLSLPVAIDRQSEAILLAVRLPRVTLAMLSGAALAVAGAAMQALFRNPLADPGIIGVSSGAAFGAALMLMAGGAAWQSSLPGQLIVPLAAFVGGLAVTLAAYRVARVDGQVSPQHLLLTGLALNALAGAGTGLLIFLASDAQLRTLTFWNLGSLGGATWSGIAAALPWMLVPVVCLPRLAAGLNALLLGEVEVFHLGFERERLKRQVVALSAMAVGAAVSLSGVISFVGLVVPHLVRLWLGPDHRRLLPCSALLGASLLLLADLAARTLAAPAEVPIGILTGLLGAPFLLWLLRRQRFSGEA